MVDPVGKQNQGNVVLPLAVSAGKLSLNVLTTALFFKINLASTWFLPFFNVIMNQTSLIIQKH